MVVSMLVSYLLVLLTAFLDDGQLIKWFEGLGFLLNALTPLTTECPDRCERDLAKLTLGVQY